MNACPVCRAAWPHASSLHHAVCPACFAVFQKHEGQWQQVPPGWNAQAPIPFPIGTVLRLRSIDHRVVGFASYSYQIEYGRDQWDTYERHEYTLTDVAGGNPRLLCWTSYNWFFARPVDAALVTSKNWAEAQFEGRQYKLQQPQSFTSQQAAGFLTHPFRWRELVSIADFVSDRHVIAYEHPNREFRWVGEILDPKELLTALAAGELPAAYRNSAGITAPGVVASPGVAARKAPPASQALRVAGVLLAVVTIFAAIGTAAYQYERYTKPVATKWFTCEVKPAQARVPVPAEASRLHLDPHLPQGVVEYQLKILNAQGAVLEAHKDFLDMSPKRRALKLSLPVGAAAVETSCTVQYGIAGVPAWPIEIRFLR